MKSPQSRTITVEYFAMLREDSGRNEERVETTAESALELFRELQERHGFKLDPERLKVVVNEEFCEWSKELKDGDTVVFVPPVAGGRTCFPSM